MIRDFRQEVVYKWTTDSFGADHANNVEQRAIRFLEESIELYQACGGSSEQAHKLIDFIFAKPRGCLEYELGDVGFLLLSLAAAAGCSAEAAERSTVRKNLKRDPADMRRRNQEKNAAGFSAGAYPVTK